MCCDRNSHWPSLGKTPPQAFLCYQRACVLVLSLFCTFLQRFGTFYTDNKCLFCLTPTKIKKNIPMHALFFFCLRHCFDPGVPFCKKASSSQ